DRAIVALLQKNARASNKEVAASVGVAPSTALERTRRLEADGVLRGYHAFRHSFASNLAAAGVDQRVIDELMGHTTVEMQKRYRHLFPDQRRAAILTVFGG
ncbi:MAG: AsnC family transcriptional regulator, partial [Gemmataceae bacterium]